MCVGTWSFSETGVSCFQKREDYALSFSVSGPTLTIIVEATKKGLVVLCRSPEDARVMWQACETALKAAEDRGLLQALYVLACAQSPTAVPPSLSFSLLHTCTHSPLLARHPPSVACVGLAQNSALQQRLCVCPPIALFV